MVSLASSSTFLPRLGGCTQPRPHPCPLPGQYYPAVVRKVNGDTCEVEYTEYSETATVQTQSLRAGKESAKDSSEKKAGDKRTHSEAAAAAAAAAAAPSSSAASSKQHADLAAEGKTLKDVEVSLCAPRHPSLFVCTFSSQFLPTPCHTGRQAPAEGAEEDEAQGG